MWVLPSCSPIQHAHGCVKGAGRHVLGGQVAALQPPLGGGGARGGSHKDRALRGRAGCRDVGRQLQILQPANHGQTAGTAQQTTIILVDQAIYDLPAGSQSRVSCNQAE